MPEANIFHTAKEVLLLAYSICRLDRHPRKEMFQLIETKTQSLRRTYAGEQSKLVCDELVSTELLSLNAGFLRVEPEERQNPSGL
jgi:hypothetical protein